MARSTATSPDQLGLFGAEEHDRSRLSLVELEERIARYEAELSQLKRLRRSKLGGLAAAGRPRKRRFEVALVLESYAKAFGPDGRAAWGARRATADKLGMTERHLGRIIADNRDQLNRLLERQAKRQAPS